ncbi:MAG TPA: MlaD family protein [Tepidisphaeraceae bacterium]|nr:MlaD family protein [Tepidisphaeraceae bacterium]
MSPYRRNILVGVTVLGAMITLGWMILKFGDQPARFFATPSQPLFFNTDRADGLGEGSSITYRGVVVGRVKTVARSENGQDVIITAEVDRAPPLPGNVRGEITMVSALGGTSTIVLAPTGPTVQGQLQPGARLQAHFVGLQFLPPEFADLARELRTTAQQFRESQVIAHIDQQVQRAGKVLESANQLISDPTLRDDLKATMANIRAASETINKVGGKLDKLADDASGTMGDVRTTVAKAGTNIDTIGKQVGDRLTQVSATLDHFRSIASKIDNGNGTAGQLVNDPKLYQALVDSSLQLNATIGDLKRLVEQWEQEGLHFKLTK